jgi:hypothetical protein
VQKGKPITPHKAGDGNSWVKGLELQRAAVAAGDAATTTAEALWTTVHGIKV